MESLLTAGNVTYAMVGAMPTNIEIFPSTLIPKTLMSNYDHPTHYNVSGMEAIDVIEAFDLGFRLGNSIKYILRAGRKGDRIEDLQKAQWYLTREIEHEIARRQDRQVFVEVRPSC